MGSGYVVLVLVGVESEERDNFHGGKVFTPGS